MAASSRKPILPNPLIFSWDPEKNRTNSEKHGFSFQAAAKAFEDPQRMMELSTRSHVVELRYLLTGRNSADPDSLVTVGFTIRDDQVRIFMARRASRDERREYRLRQALS